MHIGIEHLATTSHAVPSLTVMIDRYVESEQLVEKTEQFCDYGDQLFTTFDNICSIGATARRYGSAEGMAVLDALVGRELGGHVSVEDLKETAKKVWANIKKFFAKIWEWIKYFFYRILNFFGGAEKRLKDMLDEYNSAKEECEPWSYAYIKGDIKEANKWLKDEVAKATNSDFDMSDKVDAFKNKFTKADRIKVNSNHEAKQILTNAISIVKQIPDVEKEMKKDYKDITTAVHKAESDADIKLAKQVKKAMTLRVKLTNILIREYMRGIASIMANGRYTAKMKEK